MIEVASGGSPEENAKGAADLEAGKARDDWLLGLVGVGEEGVGIELAGE